MTKHQGEVISFDDERFLRLYKLPAEPDDNKRARLIYKALEIYNRILQKKEKKC